MPESNFKSLDLYALRDSDLECLDHLDLEMDLGDLEMKAQVDESFDDLIRAERYKNGNLYDLTKARLLLKPDAVLRLVNTHKGKIDELYLRNLDILLTNAGFADMHSVAADGAT